MSLTETLRNAFGGQSNNDEASGPDSLQAQLEAAAGEEAIEAKAENLAKIKEHLKQAEELRELLRRAISDHAEAEKQLTSALQKQADVKNELQTLINSGAVENAETESKIATLNARDQLFIARIRQLEESVYAKHEAFRPLLTDVFQCVQRFGHRCLERSRMQLRIHLTGFVSDRTHSAALDGYSDAISKLTDFGRAAAAITHHGDPMFLMNAEDLVVPAKRAFDALATMPGIVKTYVHDPSVN